MWQKKNDRTDFNFYDFSYRYKIDYTHRTTFLQDILYMEKKEFDEQFPNLSRNIKTFQVKKVLKKLENWNGWLTNRYETNEWTCTPCHDTYGISRLLFTMKKEVVYFNPVVRKCCIPSLNSTITRYRFCDYEMSLENCTQYIHLKDIEFCKLEN